MLYSLIPNIVCSGCGKAQGQHCPHEGVQPVADFLNGSSPCFDSGGVHALHSYGIASFLLPALLVRFVRETGVDSPFVFLPLVLRGFLTQENRS